MSLVKRYTMYKENLQFYVLNQKSRKKMYKAKHTTHPEIN